jgi:dethiobiotin synthetase
MRPVFVTGTGTDVGKSLASAILVKALTADYWKPVQAGYDEGTDSECISQLVSDVESKVHPELYKLKLAASPHLAARQEGIEIDINRIAASVPSSNKQLVIEGAGGIMVPLNSHEFVIDLISKLNARVILVSRNYLGSINHSLLTAFLCRQKKLDVIGWIFNDEYGEYTDEIAYWSGYPVIGNIPRLREVSAQVIAAQAGLMKENIIRKVKNGLS